MIEIYTVFLQCNSFNLRQHIGSLFSWFSSAADQVNSSTTKCYEMLESYFKFYFKKKQFHKIHAKVQTFFPKVQPSNLYHNLLSKHNTYKFKMVSFWLCKLPFYNKNDLIWTLLMISHLQWSGALIKSF